MKGMKMTKGSTSLIIPQFRFCRNIIGAKNTANIFYCIARVYNISITFNFQFQVLSTLQVLTTSLVCYNFFSRFTMLEYTQESDISDPEFELYKSETSKDPGINQFWRLLKTIDKTEKPSDGYMLLMKELSSYTSTLAIMQVVIRDLIGQLVKFLKDSQAFWRGTTHIDIHMLMRQHYPILMDIILALSDDQGVIALPVR